MKTEQQSFTGLSLETVKTFMVEKGWQKHQCGKCGRFFFSKPSTKVDTSTCGWHKCSTGDYPFLSFSKSKRLSKPAQISEKLSTYFQTVGFNSTTSRNIANFDGQTDLVIAGVQMFDNIIHNNGQIETSPMFVAQPCVRMQYQPYVASQEGTSTSFVNVCTEQMGASFEEHLVAVDYWCTSLSKLGLHMNDFVIVMRTSEKDWGTGKFSAIELFFVYGGLELGDAAYLSIPQATRLAIPISDIGFGLERIAWAINKTESYFEALLPLSEAGTKDMFDSCRTLALLVLCGVQASNKGPGLQFRRFAKVLSEKYYSSILFEIIGHYIDYWEQFVKSSVKKEDALKLARLEIDRFINLRICESLNLPPPRDETLNAYMDRLVYTCNISICELRKAIQTCKK
jgi:hypothetical protein